MKQRNWFGMAAVKLQHIRLKWITGGSGGAKGPFQPLSTDGTGCLGWLVSYLPWRTNIHRGPTPFGTLKSFFPTLDGIPAWVDHKGLRHGCHMAPFYSPRSSGLWDAQHLNVHKRIWQYVMWQRHFGSWSCYLQAHQWD